MRLNPHIVLLVADLVCAGILAGFAVEVVRLFRSKEYEPEKETTIPPPKENSMPGDLDAQPCPTFVVLTLPCILPTGHEGLHRTCDPTSVAGKSEVIGYPVTPNRLCADCLSCERDWVQGGGKSCGKPFEDVEKCMQVCTRPLNHDDCCARI